MSESKSENESERKSERACVYARVTVCDCRCQWAKIAGQTIVACQTLKYLVSVCACHTATSFRKCRHTDVKTCPPCKGSGSSAATALGR